MTDVNGTVTPARTPEGVALKIINAVHRGRFLIGLTAIFLLTGISMTFNFQLGKLSASDEISDLLLPVGYMTLDIAALFLASWLQFRSRSWWRKSVAWLLFIWLMGLSLWAGASYTLANDARLMQSNNDKVLASKQRELSRVEQQLESANAAFIEGKSYRHRRYQELDDIQARYDELLAEIENLDEALYPISLAIYYQVSALLHSQIDIDIEPERLAAVFKMLWSFAMTISPFILTALIVFEAYAAYFTASPSDGPRKRLSPGERAEKGVRQGKGQKGPQNAQNAHSTGISVARSEVELDANAYESVRQWLKRQSGRVTREKIKYRSGNPPYQMVSRIIAELQRNGLLEIKDNGHYYVTTPTLKAVG